MGSIEEPEPVLGTFTFPVEHGLEYDPWTLEYFRPPPAFLERTVTRTFPMRDVRPDIFNDSYSLGNSRKHLSEHGFTAIKHNTALNDAPYGDMEHFRDVELVNRIYYPEVEKLVKELTGCRHVFITDSSMRTSDSDRKNSSYVYNKAAAPSANNNKSTAETNHAATRVHKSNPTPPSRVTHWDATPLGSRQVIRNWSEGITAFCKERGIIPHEDDLCSAASTNASHKDSDPVINEQYNGPRYAYYSVWRPIEPVTRDPLAMLPIGDIITKAHPDLVRQRHMMKQPGPFGDFVRELAVLQINEHGESKGPTGTIPELEWRYVSNQTPDEVIIVKSCDTDALPVAAKTTGEADGCAHGSPDLGTAAHGEPRKSIEVRLLAVW